jgi:hypothetical protein
VAAIGYLLFSLLSGEKPGQAEPAKAPAAPEPAK